MREMYAALRKLGFERDYVDKSGGDTLIVYSKDVDERRTIDVQLWASGMMRASSSFKGCSDTAPTEFTDIVTMQAAVAHESTRMDGKYSLPGSLHGESEEPKC